MGLLDGREEVSGGLLAPSYPSRAEARKWRGLIGYGEPVDGYLQTNKAMIAPPTISDGTQFQVAQKATPQWASRPVEQLAQAALALKKTAIGSLGFNPDKVAFVDRPMKVADGRVLGAHTPFGDQTWTSGEMPSVIAHESIHAGLQELRRAGINPMEGWDGTEEDLVRASVAHFWGDVEAQSAPDYVKRGKDLIAKDPAKFKEIMDRNEWKAAEILAKRKPRGPR